MGSGICRCVKVRGESGAGADGGEGGRAPRLWGVQRRPSFLRPCRKTGHQPAAPSSSVPLALLVAGRSTVLSGKRMTAIIGCLWQPVSRQAVFHPSINGACGCAAGAERTGIDENNPSVAALWLWSVEEFQIR